MMYFLTDVLEEWKVLSKTVGEKILWAVGQDFCWVPGCP